MTARPSEQESPAESPWDNSSPPRFLPDFMRLSELLDQPLRELKLASSGNWAGAIDAWVAEELRRAGFPDDEVWPRATGPRVLPREVALLLRNASPGLREQLEKLISRTGGVVSSDARVLGKAYIKQVDVVIAQWSRGPELLVSTKTMMSSFRKNLPNRFEEAYGDAANLRGRYPLASIGFLFVMRGSVLTESGTLQRAVDMLRKLNGPDSYDSTGLILLDYLDKPGDDDQVEVLEEEVPEDLRAGRFFEQAISRVLDVAPVDLHVRVRENREHRALPLGSSTES